MNVTAQNLHGKEKKGHAKALISIGWKREGKDRSRDDKIWEGENHGANKNVHNRHE